MYLYISPTRVVLFNDRSENDLMSSPLLDAGFFQDRIRGAPALDSLHGGCSLFSDALAMFGESSSTLCDIFEEILNCTNTVLAWNGFQSKDERALLKEALHKIGSRYNAQLSQVCEFCRAKCVLTAFRFVVLCASMF